VLRYSHIPLTIFIKLIPHCTRAKQPGRSKVKESSHPFVTIITVHRGDTFYGGDVGHGVVTKRPDVVSAGTTSGAFKLGIEQQQMKKPSRRSRNIQIGPDLQDGEDYGLKSTQPALEGWARDRGVYGICFGQLLRHGMDYMRVSIWYTTWRNITT
jgi:hypothetical protein